MNRDDDGAPAGTETGQGLDFEHADFGDASEHASTGALSCSICESPIADQYFIRDTAFVCARCEGPARAAGPPGSGFGRLAGALAVGTLAAIVASALWMAVTELTGYEIGLIAIAVGWIVGVAIQLGSRGVGGLPYQLIAVFLTYTAIVMTYVPLLVAEFRNEWTPPPSESSQAEDFGLDHALHLEPLEARESPTAADGDETPALASAEAPENVELAAWLIAIPFAYAVPFLSGFENAIGILIIGFALYQAWQTTAKAPSPWSGPFQVGSERTG